MPLSRPDTYSAVLNTIWDANPKSILDVGIGWGGMGVMFRQICDIRWGRLHLWETLIHGLEINREYSNPLWVTVYNHVYIGDISQTMPQTEGHYDIIYLGDVVEHFEADKAKWLIEEAVKKANNMVIITTPASFADNKDEAIRFANPHEEHKCLIDESFYPKDAIVSEFGNQKLIIIKKK